MALQHFINPFSHLCICFLVCLSAFSKQQMTLVGSRRKAKAPLCLVKDCQGEGHIGYHNDICPIEPCNYLLVMTLLSPAPSERLRRMRPKGVLPPSTKKEEIAGGISQICPLSPTHCVLLCPPAHQRMRKLCKLVLLLCKGGQVIFVQPCVHYQA